MLPILSESDTQKLAQALAQVYPATDSICDLRPSWSFSEETTQMQFGFICFVHKCSPPPTTELKLLFDALLKHSSPTKEADLLKDLAFYLQHTTPPHQLNQVYVTEIDKGEKVIQLTINAQSTLSTIDDLDKILKIGSYVE